jgi:hypothetical protein
MMAILWPMYTHNCIKPGQSTALAEHAQSCSPAPQWAALIDDTLVPAPQREVLASVLLAQSGAKSDHVLVRDHGGQQDVVIADDEVVNLEHGNVFYTVPSCDAPKKCHCTKPAKLAFFVDDRPEITFNPNQTGKTIRELFGLKDDVNLVRDYESPDDEPVALEDAAPFGKGPVFYTRRQHTQITIIVNGREKTVSGRTISYEQVVRLAFDSIDANTIYTVAYKKGPASNPQGSMVAGDVVKLECGMIFNVTPTGRS